MDLGVAVDLLIGMSFLFLLLSIIASGLSEWVSRFLTLRAQTLRQGIYALVVDKPRAKEAFANLTDEQKAEIEESEKFLRSLFQQPSIKTLSRTAKPLKGDEMGRRNIFSRPGGPSTIPANRFVDALVATALAPESSTNPSVTTTLGNKLDDAVRNLKEEAGYLNKLPGLVAAQIDLAQDKVVQEVKDSQLQVAAFRRQMEDWYDQSMDRVRGWYKRKLQYVLFGIGLVLAVSMNVNAFVVANELWKNDAQREAIVLEATNTDGSIEDGTADRLVEKLPIPIGWSSERTDPRIPDDNWAWVAHVLGWIVTAAAISMGAPFWFDLMNKFIDLRGGGKDSSRNRTEGTSASAT